MKLWHTLGISLAVALALLLAGQGSAFALVEQLTLDKLTAKADSILVGEVTDIACYQEGKGYIYTLITLSVEQTIKGETQGEVVIRLPGGEVDGLGLWVEDVPSFQLGERTVIFLEEIENAFKISGWYQGKFTVRDDRVVERDQSLTSFVNDISSAMHSEGIDKEGEIRATITLEKFPIEGPVSAEEQATSTYFAWCEDGVWSEKSEYTPTEAFIDYSQFVNYGNTSNYTVYFYLYNSSGFLEWIDSATDTLEEGYYVTWTCTLVPAVTGASQWASGDWQFGSEVQVALAPDLAEERCINKVIAGGEPHIDSMSPTSGSAGTGFEVTLNGTNFGATQGTSTVTFWRGGGDPSPEAAITFWSDTQIRCQVPSGASSGDTSNGVRVTTADGISNDYPFTVTFSYSGQKWFLSNPMGEKFLINPNTADCTGEWQAVIDAMQTWNDVDNANFYLEYGGLTSATDYSQNDHNEIMWVNYDTNSIAMNWRWYWVATGEIFETDIVFNNLNYNWYANGTPSLSQWDVQEIATHELGHSLCLLDLYGTADSEKTMYGFGDPGETKARTLEAEDIAGIRHIYPGTGTRGQYHISVTNNDDDNLTVYFKADSDVGYQGYRQVYVPSGQTQTSFWEVVPAGSHQVSIKWTDPDKGTEDFLTSQWLNVPLEGDTGFAFTIPQYPAGATPTVTTNNATNITTNSATLNGNLGDLGTASTVYVSFDYGLTTAYGSVTTSQPMTTTGPFNFPLTGLSPNTTYHFRAKAVDDGTSYGWDKSFTTSQVGAVEVSIDAPAEVAPNSNFTADVYVSQVENFDAASYNVSVDDSILRLDNVTSGQLDTTTIPVDIWNEISPGTYTIIQNVPGLAGVDGNGTLAILHFHVVGTECQTSQINLSNGILGNNLAQKIPATWIGNSVHVATSAVLPGDANGDGVVNNLDITKVERIIVGLDTETPGADANQDGAVNNLDITKVERIIVGLD